MYYVVVAQKQNEAFKRLFDFVLLKKEILTTRGGEGRRGVLGVVGGRRGVPTCVYGTVWAHIQAAKSGIRVPLLKPGLQTIVLAMTEMWQKTLQ